MLQALHQHGGRETYAGLARELDGECDAISEVELHHMVVPKLEASDLIDADDGVVELNDSGRAVVDWLTQVTPR